MYFQAAVLYSHNSDLVLEELETPETLQPGQVLVRVLAAGICGAQVGEIAGVKGPDPYMPHCLGHEGAGTVLDVGPGVSQVRRGDHVVMHWRKGRGIEAPFPRYKRSGGDGYVGGGRVTTFNELAVVSENRLTKISFTVPLEIAALLGCAVTTGLGVISHEARVKIGQSVAVFGCGGVGLNVIQGAALAGAYPVIGVDIYQEKLHLAFSLGATHTTPDLSYIREWCPDGVDVAIDTTGVPRVIEQAFELTASDGCLHLVAQVRFDQGIHLQTLPMHSGKTILASDGGHTNPTVDIPRYLKLFEAGRLKLDGLITHRAPLASVNMLFNEIRAGKVGRAVITMSQVE